MAQIIYVTNLSSEELNVYCGMNEAQLLHYNEPREGLFIAESAKVIARALDKGYEPVSMLVEQRRLQAEAAPLISCAGDIPVYVAGEDALNAITGYNLTGGVLCAMKRKPLPSPETLCKNARRIAVLEGVVNPTNIGAIFRSAAAMGIEAVLLTPACCDPLYRRSVRVSMGNVFLLPWTYICDNERQWQDDGMDILHEAGFKTAAMALRNNTLSIRDERLKKEEKLAILLGTEGEGLTDGTISKSDYTVKIPMTNGVDSLNVAAASAVAFWELAMN